MTTETPLNGGSANGRVVPRPRNSSAKAIRQGSIWVANVVKLLGAAIAGNETLVRSELRPGAIAIAALMIAGVQALESIIDRILER